MSGQAAHRVLLAHLKRHFQRHGDAHPGTTTTSQEEAFIIELVGMLEEIEYGHCSNNAPRRVATELKEMVARYDLAPKITQRAMRTVSRLDHRGGVYP